MNPELIATVYDLFLSILLFLSIFGFVTWLISASQSSSGHHASNFQISPSAIVTICPLACLLEDAPSTALKGQFYPLATPLMTPLACLLEDAPSTALTGQAYSFSCIVTRTWQEYYRQNLGKPGINYWQWQNFPEVNNVSPELSLLLKLPKPQGSAKAVLENLPQSNDSLLVLKHHQRLAWQQWHNQALRMIDKQALAEIYRVCYQVSWTVVQNQLDPLHEIVSDELQPWWKILGVTSAANSLQVETAYKKLLRRWHPDLNQSPYATEITARLNIAYEQYQQFQALKLENKTLLTKIRQWVKPFKSR
ncbi:heat shock protein DnaJ domain protein [Stanieria sp. NIES-3757]|nr:heat shock protein DnaJ domain protein [Stanieria sp. NIES-3757]